MSDTDQILVLSEDRLTVVAIDIEGDIITTQSILTSPVPIVKLVDRRNLYYLDENGDLYYLTVGQTMSCGAFSEEPLLLCRSCSDFHLMPDTTWAVEFIIVLIEGSLKKLILSENKLTGEWDDSWLIKPSFSIRRIISSGDGRGCFLLSDQGKVFNLSSKGVLDLVLFTGKVLDFQSVRGRRVHLTTDYVLHYQTTDCISYSPPAVRGVSQFVLVMKSMPVLYYCINEELHRISHDGLDAKIGTPGPVARIYQTHFDLLCQLIDGSCYIMRDNFWAKVANHVPVLLADRYQEPLPRKSAANS